MAIIENIINVLVPLLICGLIFIYFRRRITNLEQSVDIIMKMLQTNQLNSGGGTTNVSAENAVVTPDDVYVPSADVEIKRVEMNLEENNEEEDSSDSESEDEESSSSESESEPESSSVSETEESKDKLSPIQEEEDGSLNENEVSSFLESSNIIEETLNNSEEESKTILLSEEVSQKEQLEKKTLNELKKLLKEKNPDVNNLSRMNKATVIENLMN